MENSNRSKNVTTSDKSMNILKPLLMHYFTDLKKTECVDAISLNSSEQGKCVGKDLKAADLMNIFISLEHKHNIKYLMKYIVKVKNNVHCTLCNCDICATSIDLAEISNSIERHLGGIHLKNIVDKMKSLPKYNDHVSEVLEIIEEKLMCNLCFVKIQIEDEKSTLESIHRHFKSKKHVQILSKGIDIKNDCKQMTKNTPQQTNPSERELIEEIGLVEGDVFFNLPEHLSVNRYYIFMNINGRYFCQLCSCSVDVNKESVLIHIESKHHLKLIKIKSEFKSSSVGKNNIKKNHLEGYGPLKDSVIFENTSNQTEKTEIKIKLEPIINKDYEELKNKFKEPLHQIFENNQQFIVKFGKFYKCLACDVKLMFSSDIKQLNKNFKPHLRSYLHKQSAKMYLDFPPTRKDTKNSKSNIIRSKNSSECSSVFEYSGTHSNNTEVKKRTKAAVFVNKDYEELKIKFKDYIPRIIEKNQQLIVKFRNLYKCSMCDVVLTSSVDITQLRIDFSNHFKSLSHKLLVNKYSDLPTNENQEIKSKHLSLESLEDFESCMKASDLSNLILKYKPLQRVNLIYQTKSNVIPELTDVHNSGSDKEINSLKSKNTPDYECLKQILYPYLPQSVEENKMFIVKQHDHFLCILCDAKLYILSNVKTVFAFCQHFEGKQHLKKVLRKKEENLNMPTVESVLKQTTSSTDESVNPLIHAKELNSIINDTSLYYYLTHPEMYINGCINTSLLSLRKLK